MLTDMVLSEYSQGNLLCNILLGCFVMGVLQVKLKHQISLLNETLLYSA